MRRRWSPIPPPSTDTTGSQRLRTQRLCVAWYARLHPSFRQSQITLLVDGGYGVWETRLRLRQRRSGRESNPRIRERKPGYPSVTSPRRRIMQTFQENPYGTVTIHLPQYMNLLLHSWYALNLTFLIGLLLFQICPGLVIVSSVTTLQMNESTQLVCNFCTASLSIFIFGVLYFFMIGLVGLCCKPQPLVIIIIIINSSYIVS